MGRRLDASGPNGERGTQAKESKECQGLGAKNSSVAYSSVRQGQSGSRTRPLKVLDNQKYGRGQRNESLQAGLGK